MHPHCLLLVLSLCTSGEAVFGFAYNGQGSVWHFAQIGYGYWKEVSKEAYALKEQSLLVLVWYKLKQFKLYDPWGGVGSITLYCSLHLILQSPLPTHIEESVVVVVVVVCFNNVF